MPTRRKPLISFIKTLTLLLAFGVFAVPANAQAAAESAQATKSEPVSGEAVSDASDTRAVAMRAKPDSAEAKADSVKAESAPLKTLAEAPAVQPPPSTKTPPLPPAPPCERTIKADVVTLAQPIMMNRLGAAIPGGMIFALKKDTDSSGTQLKASKRARPIVLRANVGDCLEITLTNWIPKANFVDPNSPTSPPAQPWNTSEVSIHVQGMEWVTSSNDDGSFVGANNSSLASAIASPSKTTPPPPQKYTLYAKAEGTYLLYTMGDTTSTGNQLTNGLFGALNVQPQGAEWYRSQVTADDLLLATYNANRPDQVPPGSLNCATPTTCTFTVGGKTVQVIKTPDFGTGPGATRGGYLNTLDNHPLVDYNAVYPAARLDGTPIPADLVGTPILKMLDTNNNLVYSDLTAMITGPNAGRFPGTTGPNNPEPPCNAENTTALNPPPGQKVDPLFCKNPAAPDRKQPYREITVIYHGALGPIATQAFPILANDSEVINTTVAGQDAFAINYGTGGIGAEIFANRIGVGPMGDCVDCKFEEFFLSAWSVGDPAMLVDRPANTNLKPDKPFPPPFTESPVQPLVPPPPPLCTAAQLGDVANSPNHIPAPDKNCVGTRNPASGFPYSLTPLPKATRVYYPDDPSNVYHSYINDHLKFRILHGGRDVSHVHHQHAHQWLQSPNSDEASYLDSQMISPGASYTLEMVYNGSGNRNKVVGDSIFHCHFYPHFAAGMWAMWRTHDVFEAGTFLYPDGTLINNVDTSGQVVPGSRALPDGEIKTGSPNPAIVPLPTLPMAPLPAYTQIQNNVQVNGTTISVGGQIVLGGTCQAGQINGLDVVGGCTDGQKLNGTVIHSQYDFARIKMVGQFKPSTGNQLENPGYPYFIPGIAGARAPHPPFDFAPDGSGGFMDGGLPRHVVTGGTISREEHNRADWSKDLATMNAVQLPEDGTEVEKAAITFFKTRCHSTFFPDGTPGVCPPPLTPPFPATNPDKPPTGFLVNGLPLGPQMGAPFADPAVDDSGNPVGTKRIYKAAAIQLDVTFNKKGWHFPQQRMLTLWKDVMLTFNYKFGNPASGRQPEPLFFRGNSGDIIEYWHTNLVPNYYQVDDFQVRTPTDILGQHIHLVKFDVTSSDGAGNGFNYEDGTFSPEEVQEMIKAINKTGGLAQTNGTKQPLPDPNSLQYKQKYAPPKDIFDCTANPNALHCLPCQEHLPDSTQCESWLGAQTTIQRWYLDPLMDNSNVDRTMRTVFTHDHFGPSTHQQAGLYAGLLIEPQGSTWTSNDGASTFSSRSDGGPTSWQARILTSNPADSYREFMLEFQDLQLAYAAPSSGGQAINAPSTPSLITTGIPVTPAGTQSVNYTNDPIAWRVGQFGDLSSAYDSSYVQPGFTTENGDPVTPLMRAYQNDKVQIRILVGAHVFAHQFNLEGPTWFSEPSWTNSGYRSVQAMGLSEHFELLFNVPPSSAPSTGRKCPDMQSQANCADYLYSPSLDETGIANGLWGLFRAYDPTKVANNLKPLPNNPVSTSASVTYATCPATLTPPAVKRVFNVTAVTSQKALPSPGEIVFNSRGTPLTNANGVMYVRTEDLINGMLKPGVPVEPLILRANAGDCIEVNLTNALDTASNVFSQMVPWPAPFSGGGPQSHMSKVVGLHPQLLSYDGAQSNGINVGWNKKGQKDQNVPFGQTIKYQWYAGKISRAGNGSLTYTPVEFGSLNLFPSDPMFQHINGLFGAMIIEPQGSTSMMCGEAGSLADCWKCSVPGSPAGCDPSTGPQPTSRASATITLADNTTTFREFAPMISDNILISGNQVGAVNYRAEPWQFRYAGNLTGDFSCMVSNQLQQATSPPTTIGNPQTPIFTAAVGDKVRFRLAHPFGTGTSQVFTVHGHAWQRNPYQNDSRVIGNNNLSQWLGSRDNHGSTDHGDLVIDKAGGESGQAGDYLYTVFQPLQVRDGSWGIFRVGQSSGQLLPNAACPPIVAPQPGYVPPQPKDDLNRFIRRSPGTR